ncbi:MAG: MerR family transcriptional regulator [Chlorobi bacterium]|nr:MerR family transcriptional regulator [Chlorobiota bacterium]
MYRYSIGELERLSGIKAYTIRVWERRYDVIKPKRTPTNIRYYSEADLRRILNISILKQIGFKISRIAAMSDNELRELVISGSVDSDNYEILVETLVVAMLSLDETTFLQVISGAIKKNGIESIFEQVVTPLLDKIGFLCDSGTINPAQKSFIINLIRQKLIVAIDSVIETPVENSSRRIIFFMPESAWQETSLLFYSLIARKDNFRVLYLGASVQLESLINVHKVQDADVLFMSVDSKCNKGDIIRIIDFLNKNFYDTQKVITGLKARIEVEKIIENLSNARMVCSSEDFRAVLNDLKK